MSLIDEALAAESVRRAAPTLPDGWQPGVEWHGNSGTITGASASKSPDWSALLRFWDFDPDEYEVIEPVQVRTWDAAVGNGEVRRMWYHRANLRRKRDDQADVAELVKLIRSKRPAPPPERPDGLAYFLMANDWQLGKRGTQGAVNLIVSAIDASAARARKMKPATIWLPALGDLGENCDGHYAMQTFEVELDRRDQGILARRLLLYAIDQHRRIAPVRMPVVGGNHGENRKDGKAYTTFGDNDDVAWPEQVAEACSLNPAAYGSVQFLIPRSELTLTVQPVPDGPIVGFAHGHQFPKGAVAQKVAEDWWKGQMFGGRPVGDATILVSAHRHHLAVSQNGPRTWIQCPTSDSGSPWFAETWGVDSQPAMLSFTVSRDGWDNLKMLR